MGLQNRVTPFGEIVADGARGAFMGNRGGRIHSIEKQLTSRRWAGRRWICCITEFKGRRREVMGPGYTELFFLDEATALAAGHRPCRECRRDAFERFVAAWARGASVERPRSIDEVDRLLHAERLGPGGRKQTFTAEVADLPAGTFMAFDRWPGEAFLAWDGGLLRWSFAGYRERAVLRAPGSATVLTPRSIVAALRAGYVPEVAAGRLR